MIPQGSDADRGVYAWSPAGSKLVDDNRRDRRGLRLVRGGRERRLAGVRVAVSPAERSPFGVDVVAVEDDTYSVLSAGPAVRAPAEHPIRIWNALKDVAEAVPGSVIVRRGRPLKLLAVIHDLARDPTWKEEWVRTALGEILGQVERRRLKSLGLPPLGGVHGKLPPERFLELLRSALEHGRPATLERIWIVAPELQAGRLAATIDVLSESDYKPST